MESECIQHTLEESQRGWKGLNQIVMGLNLNETFSGPNVLSQIFLKGLNRILTSFEES